MTKDAREIGRAAMRMDGAEWLLLSETQCAIRLPNFEVTALFNRLPETNKFNRARASELVYKLCEHLDSLGLAGQYFLEVGYDYALFMRVNLECKGARVNVSANDQITLRAKLSILADDAGVAAYPAKHDIVHFRFSFSWE